VAFFSKGMLDGDNLDKIMALISSKEVERFFFQVKNMQDFSTKKTIVLKTFIGW
jgi:hypothetical protein